MKNAIFIGFLLAAFSMGSLSLKAQYNKDFIQFIEKAGTAVRTPQPDMVLMNKISFVRFYKARKDLDSAKVIFGRLDGQLDSLEYALDTRDSLFMLKEKNYQQQLALSSATIDSLSQQAQESIETTDEAIDRLEKANKRIKSLKAQRNFFRFTSGIGLVAVIVAIVALL